MSTNDQKLPDALKFANQLDDIQNYFYTTNQSNYRKSPAAAELRRQHFLIIELVVALELALESHGKHFFPTGVIKAILTKANAKQ